MEALNTTRVVRVKPHRRAAFPPGGLHVQPDSKHYRLASDASLAPLSVSILVTGRGFLSRENLPICYNTLIT